MHHLIDPHSIPEKMEFYVNEPWLIDASNPLFDLTQISRRQQPEEEEDNIRVYIPMDLNREAILRRIDYVIRKNGSANEVNEWIYSEEMEKIIYQLEIYDQIHLMKKDAERCMGHSKLGQKLASEVIARLEQIPDECAECFPFDLIDDLREEYGLWETDV